MAGEMKVDFGPRMNRMLKKVSQARERGQAMPSVISSLDKFMKHSGKRLPKVVQQYKSLEGADKTRVLKEMDRLAQKGWRIQSFGWSNGFQGGWYALMVIDYTL